MPEQESLCCSPLLNIVSGVETDNSLVARLIEFKDYSRLNDIRASTVEFEFTSNVHYILSEAKLIVGFRVTLDGRPPAANQFIAIENNAIPMLFENAEYLINNYPVEKSLYVGRSSLLHTLSTFSKEWNNTEGLNQGFRMDTIKADDGTRSQFKEGGLLKRRKMVNAEGFGGVSIELKRIFGFINDINVIMGGHCEHKFIFNTKEVVPVIIASHVENDDGSAGNEIPATAEIILTSLRMEIPYVVLSADFEKKSHYIKECRR